MKKYIIAALLMLNSTVVFADCTYNGHLYPAGTVVGGLTCQADGSWI